MAKTSALVGSAPVFVAKNILESVAYYRDVLGFEVVFQYGEPIFYAGVCRGDVTIHLQAASATKRQVGQSGINIFVDDVDALHDELKSRGAHMLNLPADRPYGMRDFDIQDLDGNFLCFGKESRVER